MIVTQLIQQILSLFLIIAFGYLLVKIGLLKSTDSKIISILSIYIIMPCVNINAFQIIYTPDILQGFLVTLVLALILNTVLALLGDILRKTGKMNAVESVSVSYPNSGNLVIPLVMSLFGDEWIIYCSAYILVQNFFMWTHAVSVLSGQKQFQIKKILTNINLISLVIGFFLFIFQIQLPTILASTCKSVAGMIGPVSMLLIGMILAGKPILSIFKNKRIYYVTAFRLIIAPLIVIGIVKLGGSLIEIANERTILTIVLLGCIGPAGTMVSQMSQLYDNEPEHCSAINVMTTLLCAITMPLMMALF